MRLLATFHHAYARAMREANEKTIAAIRAALDAVQLAGGLTGSSLLICNLAEVSLMAGHWKRAETDLQRGFAFVEQSGEHYWLAVLHPISGQAALRPAKPDLLRP